MVRTRILLEAGGHRQRHGVDDAHERHRDVDHREEHGLLPLDG
jgi:hypothetical protein